MKNILSLHFYCNVTIKQIPNFSPFDFRFMLYYKVGIILILFLDYP